jgi:hypothetical protein
MLTLTFSAYDGHHFSIIRKKHSIHMHHSKNNDTFTKEGDRIKGEPSNVREAFIKTIDNWINDVMSGKFVDEYSGVQLTICETRRLWGIIPRTHTRYFYVDPDNLSDLAGYVMAFLSDDWTEH